VAESLETTADAGPSDQRWPVSPVITELMAVEIAPVPSLLGVGAAGRSHFSLAVTAHPHRGDTLLFEVACRVHEPPGRLGSAYLQAGPAAGIVLVGPALDPACAELPRTIRWSYAIDPAGITPADGTTVVPPAAG